MEKLLLICISLIILLCCFLLFMNKKQLHGRGIFENQVRNNEIVMRLKVLPKEWFMETEDGELFYAKYQEVLQHANYNVNVIDVAAPDEIHVNPASIEHFYLELTLRKIGVSWDEPIIAVGEGRNGSAYFVKIKEVRNEKKTVICIKLYTDQAKIPLITGNYPASATKEDINRYFKNNSVSNDYEIAKRLTIRGANHTIKLRLDLEPELIQFDLYGSDLGTDVPEYIREQLTNYANNAFGAKEFDSDIPPNDFRRLTEFLDIYNLSMWTNDNIKTYITSDSLYPKEILPHRYMVVYHDGNTVICFNARYWFNLSHINVMITEPIYGKMIGLFGENIMQDKKICDNINRMYYNMIKNCYVCGVIPSGMHDDNIMTTNQNMPDMVTNHCIFMDVGKCKLYNEPDVSENRLITAVHEQLQNWNITLDYFKNNTYDFYYHVYNDDGSISEDEADKIYENSEAEFETNDSVVPTVEGFVPDNISRHFMLQTLNKFSEQEQEGFYTYTNTDPDNNKNIFVRAIKSKIRGNSAEYIKEYIMYMFQNYNIISCELPVLYFNSNKEVSELLNTHFKYDKNTNTYKYDDDTMTLIVS